MLVGVCADKDAADRSDEKARSKDQEAEQKADDRIVGNEEICGNDRCKIPVQPVVEPLPENTALANEVFFFSVATIFHPLPKKPETTASLAMGLMAPLPRCGASARTSG